MTVVTKPLTPAESTPGGLVINTPVRLAIVGVIARNAQRTHLPETEARQKLLEDLRTLVRVSERTTK